jgi:hypothetical protein
VGAETALQNSANSFYFALDQAGPNQTTLVGPVTVEGASASLRIIDTGDNVAVAISSPAPGQGNIFLNSTGVDGQTSSVGITAGATPGQFSITSIGAIAPGNILNYDQTTPSVQLGNVGGIVEVRGPEGLGQVYDDVNNPVITPTNVFTMATYNGAFGTVTDVAYTPVNSGYYLVTYALTADGAGISWGTPNGSGVLNTGLTLTQGSLVFIADSEVSYYGIQQGPLTDTRQVLVYLTGGTQVFNDFQAVGTPNAGASGGLTVNIQPFACNFGVVDAPAPPA